MRAHPVVGLIGSFTILVLVLAACAPSAAPSPTVVPKAVAPPTAPPAPAKAEVAKPAPTPTATGKTKVVFRLGWTIQGANAPWIMALEKGFYAAEGLDVEIVEGRGTAVTLQTVAAGTDTFTYADMGTTTQAVQKGMPVKGFMAFFTRSPMSLVSHKEANVRTPKDLEGKSIAVVPGDSALVVLPALFAANKVDQSKVKLVSTDTAGKTAAFNAKRVDAATGFVNGTAIEMIENNPGATQFTYADFGVDSGGQLVVATQKTLAENPAMVRGFVRASLKGIKATMDDPQTAVDAVVKRFPAAKRDVIEKWWKATIPLLDTQYSKKYGMGFVPPEQMEIAQDLLFQYKELEKKLPVDTYFTNDFLK